MEKPELIIIGAGLAGLTLAYRLKQQGIHAMVLEGRNRLGGRMETITKGETTLELGATWFADKHQSLNKLMDELGLEKMEQEYGKYAIYEQVDQAPVLYPMPAQPEATYRIKGGSQQLIDALADQLDSEQVHLNEAVTALNFESSKVKVTTSSSTYETGAVINTLPPNLLVSKIDIIPALPEELVQVSQQTHTWMGESIKAGFFSAEQFWLEKDIGTLYSQLGPFTEMYDHSGEGGFAMKGFLNDRLNRMDDQQREALVTTQLSQFFEQYPSETEFVQKAWKDDAFTYAPYTTDVFPHQNNGHTLLRKPLFENRFYMAGSETAISYPGYMDGAVEAAERVAQQLSHAGEQLHQS